MKNIVQTSRWLLIIGLLILVFGVFDAHSGKVKAEIFCTTKLNDAMKQCQERALLRKQEATTRLEKYIDSLEKMNIDMAKSMCTDTASWYAAFYKPPLSPTDKTLLYYKSLDEKNCADAQKFAEQKNAERAATKEKQLAEIEQQYLSDRKNCGICSETPEQSTMPSPPPPTSVPAPTSPPTPKDVCSTSAGLIVTNYNPKETYAGIVSPDSSAFDGNGYEMYGLRNFDMDLEGKCLNGLQATVSDLGLDNGPAVYPMWTQVSNNGAKAHIAVYVSQYAREGDATILLKNKYGKSSRITLKINVTGTQYLNRKFESKKIKFYGSWPEVNDRTKTLESEVNKILALNQYQNPNYAKLNLNIKIYENSAWNNKYAELKSGQRIAKGLTLRGFKAPGSNVLYLMEFHSLVAAYKPDPIYSMPSIYLHEAVHALHNCIQGRYYANVQACKGSSQFDMDWWSKIGLLNLLKCDYLPPSHPDYWSGGDTLPRCGFITPYGAWDLREWDIPKIKIKTGKLGLAMFSYISKSLYEDVATIKQYSIFKSGEFSKGDAVSGPYKQEYLDKLKLLDQYGF